MSKDIFKQQTLDIRCTSFRAFFILPPSTLKTTSAKHLFGAILRVNSISVTEMAVETQINARNQEPKNGRDA